MSYLDSQQQVATKVQLDYRATTDILSAAAISASTWTDILANQTFTVDDTNSVIEIDVGGFIQCSVIAGAAIASRLVIDSATTNIVKQIGGGNANNAGEYVNPLSGSSTVSLSGLTAGSHTIKVQIYINGQTGTAYLRALSVPNTDSFYMRVSERKVLPSIFSGPQPTTKQQLDYVYTGADITAQAISANTWTDVITNQNFSVDDPNSIIEINVNGFVTVGTTAANAASRVIIDSAGTGITKTVGGGYCGSWINVLAGSSGITVTGLAAGTHTVKLQVFSTSAQSLYLRPSGQSGIENLQIRVLERKQTAALVSNCLVKLAEVGVGALGQANIQFSNIPQTYRSLQIDVIGRCDAAASYEGLGVQFNGDTGANYYDVAVQSHAGSTGAGEDLGSTYSTVCFVSGASALANLASPSKIVIPNYTGTQFHKTCLGSNGIIVGHASGNNWAINGVGMWASTAAITSIMLFPASGNFVAGSVCSLYGIV